MEDGVSRPQIAQALEHLDHLVVQDTSQFLRVSTKLGSGPVEPPEIIVHFPPALLLDFLIGELGKITGIRSVLPTGEAGRALVTLQSRQCASLLYGCSIHCPGYGLVMLTCGNPRLDADWETRLGLPPKAPLATRQPLLQEAGSSPSLTASNLLAASSSSGNEQRPPPAKGRGGGHH